jgi:hypothetical protein
MKEQPLDSTPAYAVRFWLSRQATASPAPAAAAERELMERGWMTDTSAMKVPWSMARRMSPPAPGREGEPSVLGEAAEAAEGGGAQV